MSNDFPISYRQHAKKEISDDISADSADIKNRDGKNNFGMWRCEVMDALTASNLKDTLRLEKKRDYTSEEDWDKMNRTTFGLIRSYLT